MAMALLKELFLSILLVAALLSISSEARRSPRTLAARLQSPANVQCWDSLLALRSCSGEVILFFLNGQTYLGPSCCRVIRTIEHQCWATEAMLAALGFTREEGDILRGFCDASPDSLAAPAAGPVSMARNGLEEMVY